MKILLFGATGNLGKAIAEELKARHLNFTPVVRNPKKLAGTVFEKQNYLLADITKPETTKDICHGYDVVISALGKSVSMNDKSKNNYSEIDYKGNLLILNDAIRHNIKKFVYVSAFHAEKYTHLEYFQTHHWAAEAIKKSGIDYSIIKPPAIFSSFIDLIEMAKKGKLVNIGNGLSRTNPIYEGDLAKVVVNSISQKNVEIEAGGQTIYTRLEINRIIQNYASKDKKIKQMKVSFIKNVLPIIKLFSKNTHSKLAFFLEVIQHDVIAPRVGEMNFETYIKTMLRKST